jgi:hypothetical protein
MWKAPVESVVATAVGLRQSEFRETATGTPVSAVPELVRTTPTNAGASRSVYRMGNGQAVVARISPAAPPTALNLRLVIITSEVFRGWLTP